MGAEEEAGTIEERRAVRTRARLQLLGAALLFSTGGAAVKACTLDAWQVAALRAALAAPAVLLFVPEARRGFTRVSGLVGLAYAVTVILFVQANKLTTAANTIFIQSTSTLYIALLSPWLLRERVRSRDIAFMFLMAGALALFFIGQPPAALTAPDPRRGNLLAALSGVTYAMLVLGLRWMDLHAGHGKAPTAVVLGNLLAVAIALPMALPVAPAASDWLVLGWLGVFQIGAGYALFVTALEKVPALEASLVLFVEPVLNPFWAWLVHGEQPGAGALVGGGLILAATAGRAWLDSRPREPRPLDASVAGAG